MEPKPKFFIVCGDLVDAFDCKKNKKKEMISHTFLFDNIKTTKIQVVF